MLLLNEEDLLAAGLDWNASIGVIEQAVICMAENDFEQPIKPYLRYRDKKNRIIAMPAFVGGDINLAGIKWIASFPGNIEKEIPRAHSVTILNDADTGVPVAIINTALLSIIRTASVSGLVLSYFDRQKKLDRVKIGIIGYGPIGQYHLKMCRSLLGDRIGKISLYDIRPGVFDKEIEGPVEVVGSWEKAYTDSDIVITCTVSDAPYIDLAPKPGSLHLNVSLRDYKTSVYDWFKQAILVDNWEEVCREKTDIEKMHLEKGLQKEDTRSILDLVQSDCLQDYPEDASILFNPMGMAVFDIAIGGYYYHVGKNKLSSLS